MRSVIVCVDDEPDILRSLSDRLKRHFGRDYDIELASDGEDAISLCAELTAEGKDIALIISDRKMQGMGGDTLLIRLHALYPKALKIMLTGQADVTSVGNVVNAGALYRYIAKPWDETDLILTVAEAVRRFNQEQQLAEQNELLKKTNAKLNSSLSLLLATLEATSEGILVLDRAGKVVSFNQKFAKIWNIVDSASKANEDALLDIILEQLTEADAVSFQISIAQDNIEKHNFLRLKNGTTIEYYLRPQQLMGEIVGKIWSFRDLTQEKQKAAIAQHQALHDALTNLPNRILFNQKFASSLSDAANNSKLIAVMFLDLDRFKQVNDTLGHLVGDLLLQNVVQRLIGCLRGTDVLARWGGDEFVIFLPGIRRREDASEIARRLVEVLQPQFCLQGHCVDVTASIGIAIYPDDGTDSNTLLHNADVALYQAKRFGRNNYQYYSAKERVLD
ncbi:MAG: diguanylate cyclase [Oscillatoriaceae cyanobacterium Prado104]|jgi:diguanylate cyclase (GGDEF)-like protein|nr:diguanylate cyclase [Oscillatoriaceae cyanobacterium Prado104]